MTIDELWMSLAQRRRLCRVSLSFSITDSIPSFDIRHSLFDIRYSLFQSFFLDQTGGLRPAAAARVKLQRNGFDYIF
jgi:hypothetical protein